MNAKQLERASYLAAHAVLSADVSAPHLATPGARRSYTVDAIAKQIRSIFELHCSAFDELANWQAPLVQPSRQGDSLEEVSTALSSSKAAACDAETALDVLLLFQYVTSAGADSELAESRSGSDHPDLAGNCVSIWIGRRIGKRIACANVLRDAQT